MQPFQPMNHEGHEDHEGLSFKAFPSCTFVSLVVHGFPD